MRLAALGAATVAVAGLDDATSSIPKASAAIKAPPTIGIGFFLSPAPYLIVKNKGWFEEATGSKLAWKEAGSGAEMNTTFSGRGIDIGLGLGSAPVSAGISLNIPYQIVALNDIVGTGEELIVRKSLNIKSAKDLRGKKIGVPFGSTSHFRMEGFLKINNLNEREVTLLDMNAATILAAWKRGDIDGAYIWDPDKALLLEQGGALLPTTDRLTQAGYATTDVIVVRTSLIQQYPDVATAVLRQVNRALNLWKSNPDDANAIVAKEMGVSVEVAKKGMEEFTFPTISLQLMDQWLGMPGKPGKYAEVLARSARFLADLKRIKKAASLSTCQNAINTRFLVSARSG